MANRHSAPYRCCRMAALNIPQISPPSNVKFFDTIYLRARSLPFIAMVHSKIHPPSNGNQPWRAAEPLIQEVFRVTTPHLNWAPEWHYTHTTRLIKIGFFKIHKYTFPARFNAHQFLAHPRRTPSRRSAAPTPTRCQFFLHHIITTIPSLIIDNTKNLFLRVIFTMAQDLLIICYVRLKAAPNEF